MVASIKNVLFRFLNTNFPEFSKIETAFYKKWAENISTNRLKFNVQNLDDFLKSESPDQV